MAGVSSVEGPPFADWRAAIALEVEEVRCVRIADEFGTKRYVGI